MSTLEELEERVNKLEAALLAQGETLRKLEEFMNGILDREKEEAERYEREAEDRKAKLGIHMP